MQYVCGNTVVCDTEVEARRLCYDTRQAGKAVSLDGTLVRQTGQIEGGTGGLEGKSHRWEDRQVETLKQDHQRLSKRVSCFYLFLLARWSCRPHMDRSRLVAHSTFPFLSQL